MDSIMSIEDYNKYNEWKRIETSPSVIVKQTKNEKERIYYVVVAYAFEQCKKMFERDELATEVLEILKNTENLPIDHKVVAVPFWGNLRKFKHYEKLVYEFPYRHRDMLERNEHRFRLYTKSLEYQKNMTNYINLCNNAKDSWKSVLAKLGSDYGLIIKVTVCL